jgi:hypothetical protein
MEEIDYSLAMLFIADSCYTEVLMANDKRKIVSLPIGQIEKKLPLRIVAVAVAVGLYYKLYVYGSVPLLLPLLRYRASSSSFKLSFHFSIAVKPKKYIVNREYIVSVDAVEKQIVLSNNRIVPISHRKLPEFVNWFII